MTYTYAVRASMLASRCSLLLSAFTLGLVAAAAPAAAQQVLTVTAEENLRAQPRGEIIGRLETGTPLEQVGSDGPWREVTLRGWIWNASVESENRPARVVVTAADGENLRAQPNGALLGRLVRNTVLTEVERQGAWLRVERTAWIWGASVDVVEGAPAGASANAAASGTTTDTGGAGSAHEVPATSEPGGASNTDSLLAANWLRAGPSGAVLLSAPDADTLARARALTAMEVVAREGNWARVRIEGWVWEPSSSSAADSGSVLRNISAASIAGAPDSFRGRIVEWNVQFIALERAEKIRTDFYEGEPFMLARAPGEEASFVYIAVPPERVGQVERLTPLERITVLGRIRTGRSRLMAAPVLDLLELRRGE